MKRAVIIGAGQTGRGFIAPIVSDNGYHITFLDKDEKLIEQLRAEGSYEIRYFGGKKEPRVLHDFEAYTMEAGEAVRTASGADVIFVSIFASHIGEIVHFLRQAAEERQEGRLTVFCCENGVNVKKPLTDAGINAVISEGIIFCTTLKPEADKLDLISQDYPELPVDGKVDGLQVCLKGMPYEQDFPSLIQRKIYTYNFISAIVAYLGSYMGYEVYGEAANDRDIALVIEGITPIISEVIAKEYGISYETQLDFTKRAVEKFQNRDIYDTIYRNARQAERKLGVSERMMTPLFLAKKYGSNTALIELVIAAAMYYAKEKEGTDTAAVLENIRKITGDTELVEKLYENFCRGEKLYAILELLKKKS